MSHNSPLCCCRWFCVLSEEQNVEDIPATIVMPNKDPVEEGDSVDVPDWLDSMLIEEALHQLGENDLHVERIRATMATAAGDNFGSSLYRVEAVLAGAKGARSVLVKGPPTAPAIASSVKEARLFWREATMLTRLLPQMEALLAEAAPNRWQPLAARCPIHRSSPEEFLVLEDLRVQGFRAAQKGRGLGLRHALLAFRALARFHAASHALIKRDPGVAAGLDNPLGDPRRRREWRAFFEGALQALADACRTWPGYEPYADSLEKFKEDATDKITELHDPKLGEFNVILHGDFWVNNIMYRYNNAGQPKDLRLVDFQISHVASPALDLVYVLSTSLSEEVWEEERELLLREYGHALREALDALGLREAAPSPEELRRALDAHAAYALYGVAVLLPIIKASKVPDVDAAVRGDAEAGNYTLRDPEVKRWIQKILPDYKRRGWLPA